MNPIPTKELVKNPTVLMIFREFFLNMRIDYINRSSCEYRGYFGGLCYSYTSLPLPLISHPREMDPDLIMNYKWIKNSSLLCRGLDSTMTRGTLRASKSTFMYTP